MNKLGKAITYITTSLIITWSGANFYNCKPAYGAGTSKNVIIQSNVAKINDIPLPLSYPVMGYNSQNIFLDAEEYNKPSKIYIYNISKKILSPLNKNNKDQLMGSISPDGSKFSYAENVFDNTSDGHASNIVCYDTASGSCKNIINFDRRYSYDAQWSGNRYLCASNVTKDMKKYLLKIYDFKTKNTLQMDMSDIYDTNRKTLSKLELIDNIAYDASANKVIFTGLSRDSRRTLYEANANKYITHANLKVLDTSVSFSRGLVNNDNGILYTKKDSSLNYIPVNGGTPKKVMDNVIWYSLSYNSNKILWQANDKNNKSLRHIFVGTMDYKTMTVNSIKEIAVWKNSFSNDNSPELSEPFIAPDGKTALLPYMISNKGQFYTGAYLLTLDK